ncbi:hypothetical protein ACFLS8_05600 [Chloroflexota bacterium]
MKELVIDAHTVTDTIVRFIREQVAKEKRDGLVLGLSGGLDSAVVAILPRELWEAQMSTRSTSLTTIASRNSRYTLRKPPTSWEFTSPSGILPGRQGSARPAGR